MSTLGGGQLGGVQDGSRANALAANAMRLGGSVGGPLTGAFPNQNPGIGGIPHPGPMGMQGLGGFGPQFGNRQDGSMPASMGRPVSGGSGLQNLPHPGAGGPSHYPPQSAPPPHYPYPHHPPPPFNPQNMRMHLSFPYVKHHAVVGYLFQLRIIALNKTIFVIELSLTILNFSTTFI